MRLYTYHRNSAGERVRIALALKGLDYDYVSVPSLADRAYRAINPQGLMPALELDEGHIVAQSGAILDYLEETYPTPSLLPSDPVVKAQARAFGLFISAEMHALSVVRVRKFLVDGLGASQEGVAAWVYHWIDQGFATLEATLEQRRQDWPYCFGDQPGWADLHLIPQLRSARRLGCQVDDYRNLLAIEARCAGLKAFIAARPDRQPDYVAS